MIDAILSFDVDAESAILAEGARHAANAMVMTHQAFGPRVGVPRILALLAEYDLPATFFVPGLTAERYPETIDAILTAGHEVGHHSYSHRNPVELGPDWERADFERGLEALDRVGVSPLGHRAAMWNASWHTPGLVAEHGLLYDSTLMDDDAPYVLQTATGEIVELPPHWSLDDWGQYAFLPDPVIGTVIEAPAKALSVFRAELDGARRHGGLFILTCHPFLSGRRGRVEALRALIEYALDAGDVRFCSGADVARRAREDAATPRRELRPLAVDREVYPD
jgi:peptidoglycan-N-acetylglucosamine deacetylase